VLFIFCLVFGLDLISFFVCRQTVPHRCGSCVTVLVSQPRDCVFCAKSQFFFPWFFVFRAGLQTAPSEIFPPRVPALGQLFLLEASFFFLQIHFAVAGFLRRSLVSFGLHRFSCQPCVFWSGSRSTRSRFSARAPVSWSKIFLPANQGVFCFLLRQGLVHLVAPQDRPSVFTCCRTGRSWLSSLSVPRPGAASGQVPSTRYRPGACARWISTPFCMLSLVFSAQLCLVRCSGLGKVPLQPFVCVCSCVRIVFWLVVR
jgi:hypothetical protein